MSIRFAYSLEIENLKDLGVRDFRDALVTLKTVLNSSHIHLVLCYLSMGTV